jgi:membrane protein implicated in regulation of membrane protease activity
MNRKTDNFWLGLIAGIILPAFVLLIFYYSSYTYLTVPDFLRKMVFQSILFKLLSLCAVVNLGAFFFFYQTKNDKAARGVIFATMLFAFAVMFNQLIAGDLE